MKKIIAQGLQIAINKLMINNKDKKNKIVVATRTKDEGADDKYFKECVEKLEYLLRINSDSVFKSYIIYNKDKKVDNKRIEVICDRDKDPTRATAFNLVIDELNKNKENKYHLLTFSKEVELHEENIERMIRNIEKEEELIVVGYRLMDNVLSEEEYKQFANGDENDNYGIAYQVPWNTCALWNKRFVYGEGKEELRFDEICEKDKNQLGHLYVKVNGVLVETEFEGMEDGLAIAALVSNDKSLKFKLINERLPWRIDEGCEKRMKHKIKMARKNIVLSAFMNIKGYSIDKPREAKK